MSEGADTREPIPTAPAGVVYSEGTIQGKAQKAVKSAKKTGEFYLKGADPLIKTISKPIKETPLTPFVDKTGAYHTDSTPQGAIHKKKEELKRTGRKYLQGENPQVGRTNTVTNSDKNK